MNNKYKYCLIVSILIIISSVSFFSYNKFYKKNTAHLFVAAMNIGCGSCEQIEEIFYKIKGYNKTFNLNIHNINQYGNIPETMKIISSKTAKPIYQIPFLIIGNQVYQGKNEIKKNIIEIEKKLNTEKIPDIISSLNYKNTK